MALTLLLPERHPQRDFFIADIFDNLPVKDDMASMESPFFTLSTKPDHRVLEYSNGNKSLKVMPSHIGLPTIFDKDVLLYCASQVMERLNKGEMPPKTIRLSVHDFLIATNRNICGDAYERFENSLIRLRSCTVETSIQTGRTKQVEGFGLLESYGFLKNNHAKRRLVGVQITLSDWLYNSLIAKEVLTINRDYFRLRKPIERRVYEIARKHCGDSESWKVTLAVLYAKSGALSAIKHFRASVRNMAEHDHLPDYHVSYCRDDDAVTFYKRSAAKDGTNEGQGELFTAEQPETEPALLGVPRHMPPDLLEDAQMAVGVRADFHRLWQEWRNWNVSKGNTPENWRGAFIGFCQKKEGRSMRFPLDGRN